MAHFLICADSDTYNKLPGYSSKLLKEAVATTSWLLTADLTETKVCVNKKLSCIVFEHFCGPNELWNFREMLKFFLEVTRNLPDVELLKTTRYVAKFLLEGQNAKLIQELVQPSCPDSSAQCDVRNRRERSLVPSIALDSFETRDFEHDVTLNGSIRKRAFDPIQMMGMFNKMLCNQEMMVALAEYYQKNYKTLRYSRVWPIKNISAIWCCLVENMEELYRKIPEI